MNFLRTLPFCFAALLFGVTAHITLGDGDEKKVSLDKVPQKVIDAAKKAVKGIKITEAEVEEEDGRLVYELEGTADGKEYEIEVTEDGKVLEVESDDDDKGKKKDKKKDRGDDDD